MKRSAAVFCVPILFLAACNGLGAGVRLPPPEAANQPLETERDFLVGHQPEAEGYGLYSYLLFGSAPTPAQRARDLAAIAAYLNYIPPRGEIEQYVSRPQLNITYLFLTTPPPHMVTDVREGDLSAGSDMSAAEWILDHYDYGRARAVLHAVPGAHPDGPYIVSARQPLTGMPVASGGCVNQDLSHVSPEFVASWVKIFLGQSERMPGATGGLQQAVLTLRETVAVAAESLPQVQHALQKWITWIG